MDDGIRYCLSVQQQQQQQESMEFDWMTATFLLLAHFTTACLVLYHSSSFAIIRYVVCRHLFRCPQQRVEVSAELLPSIEMPEPTSRRTRVQQPEQPQQPEQEPEQSEQEPEQPQPQEEKQEPEQPQEQWTLMRGTPMKIGEWTSLKGLTAFHEQIQVNPSDDPRLFILVTVGDLDNPSEQLQIGYKTNHPKLANLKTLMSDLALRVRERNSHSEQLTFSIVIPDD